MKIIRVLCVVFCIIGLIASLAAMGMSIGGSVLLKTTDAMEELEDNRDNMDDSELRAVDNFVKNKNLLIIGYIFAMITGILGIIGPNKKPINIKPKYFWIVMLSCVILLFIFRQMAQMASGYEIYIIPTILYFVYYIKNKQEISKAETT